MQSVMAMELDRQLSKEDLTATVGPKVNLINSFNEEAPTTKVSSHHLEAGPSQDSLFTMNIGPNQNRDIFYND